jgi:hypothetical protein
MMRRLQVPGERIGEMPVSLSKFTRTYLAGSSLLLLATVLLSANSLRAQEMEATLDPARTEIHYTLGDRAYRSTARILRVKDTVDINVHAVAHISPASN